MKKTSRLVFTLYSVLLAGAGFTAVAAYAVEPPPSDAPPQTVPLEEGAPAVTKVKKPTPKQNEKLVQSGQQTEVKVTTGVGTYIVKPNENVGTSLPGDAQSNSNNPVQWLVKSWGGSRDTENKDEVPPTLLPSPASPVSK